MAVRKLNPAADPRAMRRVIAEDPEWNLETVPPLVDACINHIVSHFHEQPLLEELDPPHRERVLAKLPTNIPLKISAPLISDESFWERCCRHRWGLCCDVSEFDGSWKIMYFERNMEETIETFVPESSELKELEHLLRISSPFIRRLLIHQLIPPSQDKSTATDEEDNDGGTVDTAIKINNDHLDFKIVLKNLCHLKELAITYGVKNCGMNFQWNLFEFTITDCQLLSKALKATPTLEIFRLRESKVDNERGRVLIAHLLDHPALRILDISHNCLGSGAGRALGKLLNEHSPNLTVLNISNNRLEEGAGTSIGHALQKNQVLQKLNISMNRLGDLGVQPILKALMKNERLLMLNISSNDVGESSAPPLAEMLMSNSALTTLSVTCNRFGSAGGKLIQEGMEENKTLIEFDLRLTGISQESEYCINQMIKTNLDASKT